MEGDAKDAIGDRVVNHSPARGERDMRGLFETTPLESWSMGKSVTATLMGVLIRQGTYALNQPAPMPEWQKPSDPLSKIHGRRRRTAGVHCPAARPVVVSVDHYKGVGPGTVALRKALAMLMEPYR
jgi:hypothetical protein